MEALNLNENQIKQTLEPLRKKQHLLSVCGTLMIVLGIFSGMILELLLPRWSIYVDIVTPFFFIISVVGFIAFMIWANKARTTYVKEYKQLVSEKVLHACFEDAHYYPEQGFTRMEFENAGVFSLKGHHFTYRSEDLIIGRELGVEFKQSDVRVTHRTGSGKHERTVVDVNGRLVSFQYKKDILGRVVITSKGFAPQASSVNVYLFGNNLDIANNPNRVGELKIVSMEDVDFNNKFNVYAADAHSAYYLLTPHVMEYFKNLYGMDRNLSISFDGEQLYILRSGKGGIFEPPNDKKISISDEVNKSYWELQEIVRCIEAMHLDDRQEEKETLDELLYAEEQKIENVNSRLHSGMETE